MRRVCWVMGASWLLAGCQLPIAPTAASGGSDHSVKAGMSGQLLKGSLNSATVIGPNTGPAAAATGLAQTLPSAVNAAGTGGSVGVIAPGGGNLIGQAGTNVIAAGGGNVIAAGGGNLVLPGEMAPRGPSTNADVPGSYAPRGPISDDTSAEHVSLKGNLMLPASLVAGAKAPVPVQGATVGLYTLDGYGVGETTTSGATGEFELAGLVRGQLYVARAAFTVGGETYYLSALALAGGGPVALDALSTVLEAKYFAKAAGLEAPESLYTSERYEALRAQLEPNAIAVPLSALKLSASFASRVALYDEAAKANAKAFEGGIDAWASADLASNR